MARRSTARVAPSVTACRRSAAPAWWPRSGRRAATNGASSSSSSPTSDSLFQIFSIPTHTCQPVIPPEANVISRRVPIPLFGAGLVEAIPDETLLALEDPGRSRSRRRQRPRRRHHRHCHRPTPRRAVRMEGAARDAAGVRRRCLPERDGHHERSVSRTSSRSASRRSRCSCAIGSPIPRTCPIGERGGAGSTTSNRS